MSNKKNEFVAKLNGTYQLKLKRTFTYAYQMGYRDGLYQDLDQKTSKELDQEFKELIKRL